MSIRATIAPHLLAVGMLIGIMASQEPPTQRDGASDQLSMTPPASSTAARLTGEEIFGKLLEHNRLRASRLQQYSALRTYSATNHKGKLYAEEIVRVQYQAPDTKVFTTVRENGSSMVRSRVFQPLMNSEAEAAAGRSRHDSSITPANYSFQFLSHEDSDNCHCFVVQATPRHEDKYLFEGTVWIDDQDFAIVKIIGQPVKNPSFWIKHVEFVRTYQKIGEFWLPSKDHTEVDMKIFGDKVLNIDHQEYAINSDQRPEGQVQSGRIAVHGAACLRSANATTACSDACGGLAARPQGAASRKKPGNWEYAQDADVRSKGQVDQQV
jgi:hypothetical protein